MRPSASVVPRATTFPPRSRATATPAAGRPVAVSSTWVERAAMSGRYRTPAMRMLRITAGPFTFRARLEEQAAPKTTAAIRKLLPLRSKLLHVRWSGEATWVPMGSKRLGVEYENHTSHPAPDEIDARGLLALPGMVDAHVHFNEPGRTEWEGWATGSRAAAAGGITTVLDMPLNSVPPLLDGTAFDAKRAAAERASIVDFGLWGGLVDADPMSLHELKGRGAIGCKAFLCDSGVP